MSEFIVTGDPPKRFFPGRSNGYNGMMLMSITDRRANFRDILESHILQLRDMGYTNLKITERRKQQCPPLT